MAHAVNNSNHDNRKEQLSYAHHREIHYLYYKEISLRHVFTDTLQRKI